MSAPRTPAQYNKSVANQSTAEYYSNVAKDIYSTAKRERWTPERTREMLTRPKDFDKYINRVSLLWRASYDFSRAPEKSDLTITPPYNQSHRFQPSLPDSKRTLSWDRGWGKQLNRSLSRDVRTRTRKSWSQSRRKMMLRRAALPKSFYRTKLTTSITDYKNLRKRYYRKMKTTNFSNRKHQKNPLKF